jgi:glycosyltransferase involved in cell wall biosynthesis
VRVIRLFERRGPAGARRAGLDAARGRYVGFVDADDAARPEMFERLAKAADRTCADVVVCNAYSVAPDGRARPRTALLRSTTHDAAEASRRFLELRLGGGTLWNRLFRRELLLACALDPFDDLPINEDYSWNLTALRAARRCTIVPEFLYLCTERPGSVSRSSSSGYYLAHLVEAWATTSAANADAPPELLHDIDRLYERQLAYSSYHVRAGTWTNDDARAFCRAMAHLRAVRPEAVPMVRASFRRTCVRQSSRARAVAARLALRVARRGYASFDPVG